jgi:hypothetical protein
VAGGWVCPECGIDYDALAPGDLAVAVRSYPRRFRSLLTTFDDQEDEEALIRRKPDAGTWSALAYTVHVGDVLSWHADAVRRMLDADDPSIAWPSGDEAAWEAAANAGDREAALDRLAREAERLATALDGVHGDAWTREAEFDWGRRDLLTTARNAVHEGHHHLRDVERVLAAARGRPTS